MNDAVLLHSSWRAASTYVWAKFRQRSDAYCYFEPLNEYLLTATTSVIDQFVPWSFAHHPSLATPYLEEYRPLIAASPAGGIPGFPAHLTFGRYCSARDDCLPELEAYMAVLAGYAARLGRRPVFGFVRTDMRVAWFRARMPGTHIFIWRDPRRQFLSMLRQAVQGNPYFLQRGIVILRHNLHEPRFAPLVAAMNSPEFGWPGLLDSPDLRASFRGKLADQAFLRRLYVIFYYMRLLARQIGEPQCHLAIDIDRLSLEDSYRREIESHLGELVEMAISFADCRVERYEENLSWSASQFEALEGEIETLRIVADRDPRPCSTTRTSC